MNTMRRSLTNGCKQFFYVSSRPVSNLEFRDATKDDKNDVLSLRTNVYRGLDYLPDYYDYFVMDTNRKCIAGYIGEEMVAFGVMLIMDGGYSVLGQAGRVKEKHEGKGIFRSLTGYINELAKSAGCKRRVALVETTLNKYARSEKFRKTHKEIDTKLHYAGVITEDLRKTLHFKDNNNGGMTELGQEEISDFLSSNNLRQYLFPKDAVLLDYVPLKSISENIEHFRGKENRFFSTIQSTDYDVRGLLSAGSSFTCTNPPRSYTIDIFGSHVDDIEQHVRFHVTRACQMFKGPFCLQIFVEKGFIAQKLCSVLLKYDIPKCNWYVEGGVSTKTTVQEEFYQPFPLSD